MANEKQGFQLEVIKSANKKTKLKHPQDITKPLNEHIETVKEIGNKANKKAMEVVANKREANRLVSLANKRLRRLEDAGLTDAPAYQGFIAQGGQYFSVRGKTPKEVQAEIRRLRGFIEAGTSTVRGVNRYAREMAANTGIKYKNLTELRAITPQFFTLSSKIEQYLRTVEDMASAIDYNKIWESINLYVKQNKVDLAGAKVNIDKMIKDISQAIAAYDTTMEVKGNTFRLKK